MEDNNLNVNDLSVDDVLHQDEMDEWNEDNQVEIDNIRSFDDNDYKLILSDLSANVVLHQDKKVVMKDDSEPEPVKV